MALSSFSVFSMQAGHSPEVTLLLMACSVNPTAEKKSEIAQFLSQQSINWKRLHTLANRHRLSPFLYQTLLQQPTAPESFLATLRDTCRLSATDNLIKLHHYHQVEALLREHSIDYMPLKGIYLAEHCYPDPSLRITGDIDLLVSKNDVYRTVALLQDHQYHLSPKHSAHWQQGEEKVLADLFEIDLFKPFANNSQFDIDLHWNVMGFNKDYVLFDLAYVRSQPTHATEMIVVLLVTHHGVNGIWQQINYVNDLYFLVRKAEIDWPWLIQELGQFGFEEVFLVGLYWCWQIWDLPLPDFMRQKLTSPKIRSLANTYAKNWEAEQAIDFSYLILGQLTSLLRAQTGVGKRLKICSTFLESRVFRYSLFNVGKRLIYFPKEAGFITVFIRLFQSVFRFFPAKR